MSTSLYSSVELRDIDGHADDLADMDDPPFGDLCDDPPEGGGFAGADGDDDHDAAPLAVVGGERRQRLRQRRAPDGDEGGGCCDGRGLGCDKSDKKSMCLVIVITLVVIANIAIVGFVAVAAMHKVGILLDDTASCASASKAACNFNQFDSRPRSHGEVALTITASCASTLKAACNFNQFGRPRSHDEVALTITPSNPLYVAESTAPGALNDRTVKLARLHNELERIQSKRSSSRKKNVPRQDATCDLYDQAFLDGLGANGVLDAVNAPPGDYGTLNDVTYGKDLGQAWESQKHLLGAWIMATALERNGAPRSAIEIVGSFKLEAAPLHAAVWTALSQYPSSDARAFWERAGRELCFFAGYSLDLLVHCLHGFGHGALFAAAAALHPIEPPTSYSGKAVLPATGIGNGTTEDYALRLIACSANAAHDIVIDDNVHARALDLCHGAPSQQLGYICAAGLYMTFFDGEPAMEANTWMSPCDTTKYAGPCFRFLFQTHLAAVRRGSTDHAVWEADARATHCILAPAMDGKLVGGGLLSPVVDQDKTPVSETAVLGCLFGHSMYFYAQYDQDVNLDRQHTPRRGISRPTPRVVPNGAFKYVTPPVTNEATPAAKLDPLGKWDDIPSPMALASYCGPLRPAGGANGAAMDEAAKIVWNRRWLACIAGSMAGMAFMVDEANIVPNVIKQHCQQLAEFEERWPEHEGGGAGESVDAERVAGAVRLCNVQGMSRSVLYNARTNHTDASPGSAWDGTDDMAIWPVALLAFDDSAT